MAPVNKSTTFRVLQQNDDNTFVVAPVDAGGESPYQIVPSGTAAMNSGGFMAKINGREVWFRSEADFRQAETAFGEMTAGSASVPEISLQRNQGVGMGMGMGMGMGGMGARQRGGSGAGFLRTGADAVEAITGFFNGRNLRQKRDDLVTAINAANAARDQIGGLTSKYPDLVPALLNMSSAERDINASALGIIDDQITAMDVTAGIGVARVMSDFWDGMGSWNNNNNGGDNGAISALAVGGVGLGIGLLLSQSNRRGHRYGSTTGR